jgi:predicted nuclease of restriction endonuclease-like RecB superfamily
MNFGRKIRQKYGAKRVETDGYSFASGLEARVYEEMKLRQAAGELEILQNQPRVNVSGCDREDSKVVYIPDFKVKDLQTGEEFYVEAKGFETCCWKIKKRLWKAHGIGKLEIYKGNKKGVFISEVIYGPK